VKDAPRHHIPPRDAAPDGAPSITIKDDFLADLLLRARKILSDMRPNICVEDNTDGSQNSEIEKIL
ncbi:MAG: hypothetical protein ACNA7Q_00790, partial [Rhodobacterales bacterium]